VRGAVKKLQITRLDTCETCHGTGAIGSPQTCPVATAAERFSKQRARCGSTCLARDAGVREKIRTPCRTCGGEGRVRKTETIEVKIPPGLASGARLRVAGKGNSGTMARLRAICICAWRCGRNPFFERRGNDLYTKVPVTVSEATLGAKIEVPTIDGRSLVRIPPGTNCGSTLRLREKGIAGARGGTRGDQYVEIQVVVPKPTDERIRKLMKELEAVEPGDPRKDLFAKAGV